MSTRPPVPSSPRTEAPPVGQIIAGKYRVEHTLGAGGMGVVVAARHLMLGQLVALKLLRPKEIEDPTAVERFLREAQAIAALRSEHVVRIMDVGTLDDGAPYLVMEHLEGATLSAIRRERRRLPPAEAVGYLLQACEAVAEAHALGIVKRTRAGGSRPWESSRARSCPLRRRELDRWPSGSPPHRERTFHRRTRRRR